MANCLQKVLSLRKDVTQLSKSCSARAILSNAHEKKESDYDWYDVIDLLEHVSKKRNIIGFDVVELCPSNNAAPDFLAAKLIYKLLSLRFS